MGLDIAAITIIMADNVASNNVEITEVSSAESAKAKPVPNKQTTIMREPGAPDLPPAANTIFILDLKKEKEEKKKSGNTYSYNAGGFLGVGHLTSNKPLPGKSPQIHRKVVTDEFAAVPSTGESRAPFEN